MVLTIGASNRSTSLGAVKTVELCIKLGYDIIQLSNGPANDLKQTDFTDKNIVEIKKLLKKGNTLAVIHGKFVFNTAKPVKANKFGQKYVVLADIHWAEKMGAIGVVIHVGHKCKLSTLEAQNNVTQNIEAILRMIPKHYKTKLIIETPANGSCEVLTNLEDFYNYVYVKVLKGAKTKEESIHFKKHLGLCIDTAHLYNSGYDLKSKEAMTRFLNFIDKLDSLASNIVLIHLNDTPRKLNENVQDRHGNLLEGQALSPVSLKLIVNWATKHNIPMVLETPEVDSNKSKHLKEINMIRLLVKIKK